MFPDHSRKKTIISGLIVGGLVLAVGFGVLRTQDTKNSQVYKSQAAPASAVTLVTPKNGSTIGGVVGIEANFAPKEQLDHLYAIAKIGDFASVPLTIKPGLTITLSGMMDTSSYPNGKYTLNIFVYAESGDQPELVGRGDYDIIISH